MRHLGCLIGVILLLCLSSAPLAATQKSSLRIPHYVAGTSSIYFYIKDILQMALDVTEQEYGKVTLESDSLETVQERQLLNLESNLLDISWSVSTYQRELEHRPIRVPLVGGLFGYRVLLIRENDIRFRQPITRKSLQNLIAIQGLDWPDTEILNYNNFELIGGTYNSTFKMLDSGFVDYFPRGILEYQEELEANSQFNLQVERYVALSYANPVFFFVAKKNKQLATRLKQGLDILVNQGLLQSKLAEQEFYQRAVAEMTDRKVYPLVNPLVSPQTKESLRHYLPLITSLEDNF